jgi:hypothetical protein
MKETEDSKGEVFSGYLVREPARQQSCRRHRNGLDTIFLIVKLSTFINLLINKYHFSLLKNEFQKPKKLKESP